MSYRSQPDTSLNQCQTNGHALSSNVSMRTCQLSINAKPMGTTSWAFSVNWTLAQFNGHNLSLYVSMRAKLLSYSNQSRVSISTNYIWILKIKFNRRNYKLCVVIYNVVKLITIWIWWSYVYIYMYIGWVNRNTWLAYLLMIAFRSVYNVRHNSF